MELQEHERLSERLIDSFCQALRAEYETIGRFAREMPSERIVRMIYALLACRGKIVMIGVGKSGLIAKKIASTLSSTGSPAIYLNAAECAHGDLGVITSRDVVWFLSNSGRTSEILGLLPYIESLKVPMIAQISESDSPLEKVATHTVVMGPSCEADPESIVPTCSTTLMLAFGDAVAVALMKAKKISRFQFAQWHPGGWLGRRLATKVKHLVHSTDQCPLMPVDMPLREALHHMTRIRLGCLVSQTGAGQYAIFTDGDLRRALSENTRDNILDRSLKDFLTLRPVTTTLEELAEGALQKMENNKITQLIVLDDRGLYAGIVHIHDLLEFQGT